MNYFSSPCSDYSLVLLKIPVQSVHKDLREDCTPNHLTVQKNWTVPGEKPNRNRIPATTVVNSTVKGAAQNNIAVCKTDITEGWFNRPFKYNLPSQPAPHFSLFVRKGPGKI